MTGRRGIVLFVAILVVLIAAVTLGPYLEPVYRTISAPLRAVFAPRAVEFLLNLALFVPLGAVAGWSRSRRGLATVIALAVTVELLQAVVGRDSEMLDTVAYLTGACTAYVIVAASDRAHGTSPSGPAIWSFCVNHGACRAGNLERSTGPSGRSPEVTSSPRCACAGSWSGRCSWLRSALPRQRPKRSR